MDRSDGAPRLWAARNFALISIAAALVTISLKVAAYLITGSVGLLSDAMESGINLVAAIIAFGALTVAARPADREHAYGHSKAEYFSSLAEGVLIIAAAAAIGATAWERLLHPQPLDNVSWGLAISVVATGVNGAVAAVLIRAGKRHRSITLRADGYHLLTDVWTTVGVLVGVALVAITGWLPLDPLVAMAVAANIVWTGARLIRDTALGLMDTMLPAGDLAAIAKVQATFQQDGVRFHALRTRVAGQRRFISMHMLVPGDWPVKRAHGEAERFERLVAAALPQSTVFTHIEPVEDPSCWDDDDLDRLMNLEVAHQA